MSKEGRIVYISEIRSAGDLLRLAEEIWKTKVPATLRGDREDLVELRPAKPSSRANANGKVVTKDDSLWGIVGIIKDDGGPSDISSNGDKYLADAYSDTHA